MKIICVDDEVLLLEDTVAMCLKLPQVEEAKGFTNDLVFHFDHTEITFRLIVGKRNEGIICQTEDVSLVFNPRFSET